MNVYADIQPKDVAQLDLELLASALKALQELTWSAHSDIYTDAPECSQSVCRVETAIQAAYEVLIQIQEALDTFTGAETAEAIANRMLDEAEEAFNIKSTARERAAGGKKATGGEWPEPISIPDYLFWIEDEAQTMDSLTFAEDNPDRNEIYIQALKDLAQELRGLGFTPSPPPWEVPVEIEDALP